MDLLRKPRAWRSLSPAWQAAPGRTNLRPAARFSTTAAAPAMAARESPTRRSARALPASSARKRARRRPGSLARRDGVRDRWSRDSLRRFPLRAAVRASRHVHAGRRGASRRSWSVCSTTSSRFAEPHEQRTRRAAPAATVCGKPAAGGRAPDAASARAGARRGLAFLRWEKRRWSRPNASGATSACTSSARRPGASWRPRHGAAPCIAIAERGKGNRFVGPAFRMSDDTDLERYQREFGRGWLDDAHSPAAGAASNFRIRPGRSVWLLQGQGRAAAVARPALTPLTNTAHHTPRVNARCARRSSRRGS